MRSGYVRREIGFDKPDSQSVEFPASGSNWGTVTHVGIYAKRPLWQRILGIVWRPWRRMRVVVWGPADDGRLSRFKFVDGVVTFMGGDDAE